MKQKRVSVSSSSSGPDPRQDQQEGLQVSNKYLGTAGALHNQNGAADASIEFVL